LHLISGAVADTRLQVLDTREVVLARLDELLHHSERGDARLAELAGRIEDLTTARRPDRDAAPEWEYLPEGWARERPDARGRGWDVESVAHTYAQRWPAFVETLEGSGPLGATHVVPVGHPIPREDLISHNLMMVFAYALAMTARRADAVSVLDWGGALGHYHALARALVPDLELDYHCKELPAVCREGRRVSPGVTFHETDACLQRSYDLVLASGSIQYAERWPELFERLASATTRYLLITKVPLTDAKASFLVLQRAHRYGYDTEVIGWALNPGEVRNAARASGLEPVREFFVSPRVDVPDAPGRIYHGGFLFTPRREVPA